MSKINYALFVSLVSLAILTSATEICNKICHCNEEPKGMVVDCSRVRLNVIPQVDAWPASATDLDLTGNNITTIDVEMTQDNLLILRLTSNKITSVKPSMFVGLTKLQYLDLSHNLIEELELNTFHGLSELVKLDISFNNLKTLQDNIFANLFLVERLTISGNQIRRFSKVHLNRMFKLKELDLSDVAIYDLESDIFHNYNELEYLDISKNQFHEVPTKAIRSASHLKTLVLNDNPIAILDKKSFLGLTTLERLELNFMSNLETIDSEAFTPLTNLQVLQIKNCKNLHGIDPQAFKGLFVNDTPTLQELELEFNKLTTLVKLPCRKMSKLNLQRNPWNCDCRFQWIKPCIFEEVNAADFKCKSPSSLRGRLIVEVPKENFVCDKMQASESESREVHNSRIVRSVSLGVACAILVTLSAIIILALKWRSMRSWWRNRKKGTGAVYYVRARSNPMTDIGHY